MLCMYNYSAVCIATVQCLKDSVMCYVKYLVLCYVQCGKLHIYLNPR